LSHLFCTEPDPDRSEIRSTKYEIRNKSEILISKCSKQGVFLKVLLLGLCHLNFKNLVIVLDFDIRISSLT